MVSSALDLLSHPAWVPLWVAMGAIPGALARHYILTWCNRRWEGAFPWSTLGVNCSGSVLLGYCAAVVHPHLPGLNALLAMGFISSYTTFSTYALELSLLRRQKRYLTLLLYGLGSPLAGFLGVEGGIALGGGLVSHG